MCVCACVCVLWGRQQESLRFLGSLELPRLPFLGINEEVNLFYLERQGDRPEHFQTLSGEAHPLVQKIAFMEGRDDSSSQKTLLRFFR